MEPNDRSPRLSRSIFVVLVAALMGCGPSGSPRHVAAKSRLLPMDSRPTLAVLIVVDQFRADYISRFRSLLDGGIARIAREGLMFEQAYHEHATTQTCPGHASLATGLPPSRHGIIGNRWYDRASQQMVGCVSDSDYPSFAGASGVSPMKLRATTIGDWIKEASPGSRVISVAGKETAATLLAGHEAEGAFWYDRGAGRFTTSRYYGSSEPEILPWFARTRPISSLACDSWERVDGPRDVRLADPDDEPWEIEGSRVFPHRLPCHGGSSAASDERDVAAPTLAAEIRATPFLDDLVLALAEASLDRFELGRDGSPDLLAIGLSATDFVGHRYGPDSQEVLDQVRRLDRRLAVFLQRLNEKVGLEKTLIVLTSDHGVTSCPERDHEHRLERVTDYDLEGRLASTMAAKLGEGRWVAGFEKAQVYLVDHSARAEEAAFEALSSEPSIARVYRNELLAGRGSSSDGQNDPFLPLMRASWNADRGGDLMIRVREGWLVSDTPTGSDHGTPYEPDTHVPLIFLGPGIAAGRNSEHVSVYRVASSIASALGVPYPGDLPDGPLPLGHRVSPASDIESNELVGEDEPR